MFFFSCKARETKLIDTVGDFLKTVNRLNYEVLVHANIHVRKVNGVPGHGETIGRY